MDYDHYRRYPPVSLRIAALTIIQVALYTFVSPLASAIMSPALPSIAEQLKTVNDTITAMTLSIFLLSFAFGPLFLAPLSEIYGRTWVSRAPLVVITMLT